MTIKKQLLTLTAVLLSAQTADSAVAAGPHLTLHITGADSHHHWFLCGPSMAGCISLRAGARGKSFPLTTGQIRQAFLLNIHNMKVYAQSLPETCQVNIADNQTLSMTGHFRAEAHHIEPIDCKLTG